MSTSQRTETGRPKTERAEERRSFVDTTPWQNVDITPLTADASFRSYYRVNNDRPAVLMDAPPGKEDIRPFMAMTEYLRRLGLSAPEIYAADVDTGFLLLEDLGDDRISRRLTAAPHEEDSLYAGAIDILAHMHSGDAHAALPITGLADYPLPHYDDDLLLKETLLLPDWFIPATDRNVSDAAVADYQSLWAPLLQEVSSVRDSIVLRDYHADNLMCLDDRKGLAGIGLLDYQDAVLGHPAYDLVSLLEDARRDVPPALRQAMLERYMDVAGVADKVLFRRHYDILGAQRNAKIIGIFARLSRRDNKHDYLQLIPHMWRLLEDDLERLQAPGLTAWFNDYVTAARRREALPPVKD